MGVGNRRRRGAKGRPNNHTLSFARHTYFFDTVSRDQKSEWSVAARDRFAATFASRRKTERFRFPSFESLLRVSKCTAGVASSFHVSDEKSGTRVARPSIKDVTALGANVPLRPGPSH
jgi:hypothetical protein